MCRPAGSGEAALDRVRVPGRVVAVDEARVLREAPRQRVGAPTRSGHAPSPSTREQRPSSPASGCGALEREQVWRDPPVRADLLGEVAQRAEQLDADGADACAWKTAPSANSRLRRRRRLPRKRPTTARPHLGHISATSRPHLGYISATARLSRGCRARGRSRTPRSRATRRARPLSPPCGHRRGRAPRASRGAPTRKFRDGSRNLPPDALRTSRSASAAANESSHTAPHAKAPSV